MHWKREKPVRTYYDNKAGADTLFQTEKMSFESLGRTGSDNALLSPGKTFTANF